MRWNNLQLLYFVKVEKLYIFNAHFVDSSLVNTGARLEQMNNTSAIIDNRKLEI